MQNANLLLYINLSGEVFYIIAHRMRSQRVTEDLQQRVYNDLAVAICHPTVIQNLSKGALQLLELNLVDVRTLMDRIVHSSIMTVNAFSMEKLFELTLIATRYQYTVCHHPKDILLIALNHLDSIRKSINDGVGIKLTKNLHATLIDRMKGLNSVQMQDYRYAILTYLADVKLKMTNLIRLGLQKPTGEFVKEFPDNITRSEFSTPGKMEMDDSELKKSLDEEESGSDSDNVDNEEGPDDDKLTMEEMLDLENEDDQLSEDNGCHLEQNADNSDYENDEILEILSESEFSEFEEPDQFQTKTFVVRFRDTKSKDAENSDAQPLNFSLELNGNRGITLGLSIYDIPGNSDEDIASLIPPKQRSRSIPCQSKESKGKAASAISIDNDFIDLKAVQGLDLCSILLGCKKDSDNMDANQRLYHSPAQFANDPDITLENSAPENVEGIAYKAGNGKCESNLKLMTQVSGINVVKFDARTDRSGSKAALAKISKEFDLGETDTIESEESSHNARSPFDLISEDD